MAQAGVRLGLWSDMDLLSLLNAQSPPPAEPFELGARVLVRHEREGPVCWRRPHLRTPGYVHGVVGTVVARLDDEHDQDQMAYAFL